VAAPAGVVDCAPDSLRLFISVLAGLGAIPFWLGAVDGCCAEAGAANAANNATAASADSVFFMIAPFVER
jgi:hypothetical protein